MSDTIGKVLTAPLTLLGLGPAKPPKAPPPTVMPDPEATAAAKRRAAAATMGQTGRQSTILTGDSDRLGG